MKPKIAVLILAATVVFAYSTAGIAGSGASPRPKESAVFALNANTISKWFGALLTGNKANTKVASDSTRSVPVCIDSGGIPIYLVSVCEELYPELEILPCKTACKENPIEPCAGRQCPQPDPGP